MDLVAWLRKSVAKLSGAEKYKIESRPLVM